MTDEWTPIEPTWDEEDPMKSIAEGLTKSGIRFFTEKDRENISNGIPDFTDTVDVPLIGRISAGYDFLNDPEIYDPEIYEDNQDEVYFLDINGIRTRPLSEVINKPYIEFNLNAFSPIPNNVSVKLLTPSNSELFSYFDEDDYDEKEYFSSTLLGWNLDGNDTDTKLRLVIDPDFDLLSSLEFFFQN